jgi:LmbE family N-acetylglucosaminyl deacetylase
MPRLEPLLAVVAHPDDESFGLGGVLARLVADGHPVSLVCLTHGEASTLGTPDELRGLGEVRRRELTEAAVRLGLSTVWLHDFPDGALGEVAAGVLDETITSHVGVAGGLVVFEPGGVTGHPDHVAATAAATRVARARGLELIEWGLAEEVAAQLRGEFGIPFVGLGDGPGVTTLHVDRRTQLEAIACHRSQVTDNPVVARRLGLQGEQERVRIRLGTGRRG